LESRPPGEAAAAPVGPGEIDATARVLGAVLRAGVLLSAAIILFGVALFVHQRGVGVILLGPRGVPVGAEDDPTTVRELLSAIVGNARVPAAVTDVGLLTLMVTPVLSVIVSLVSFALARDWTYVTLATVVLCMLALGIVVGHI
jgi:uncharacterized membrane protein